MKRNEQAEEATAGSMVAVKKRKGKIAGRQTKHTSTARVSTNSFKATQPSPFAEAIDPVIPDYRSCSVILPFSIVFVYTVCVNN